MRIVSLLPSATEILGVLGLEDQLVGVSHECDFPPGVLELPKVTRALIPAKASSHQIDRLVRERLRTGEALYTLDLPLLEKLEPDLIVTQKLCDVCAVSEEEVERAVCALAGRPRVVHLEPGRLSEVFDSIRRVAEAAGVSERGETVTRDLASRVKTVTRRAARLEAKPRVVLLEWLDPPFCSGHWGPELVRLAGGIEGLGREGKPSRTLDWRDVIAWQPEVVFVACCGFGVERTLEDLSLLRDVSGWSDLPAAHGGRIYLADGSHYFSRPGPRLVDSLEMLAHALHPQVHPLPEALPCCLVREGPWGGWIHCFGAVN